MEGNKEEVKNVNLVIQNQEEQEHELITISFSGIIKNIKRLFALWLAVSILISVLAVLVGTLMNIKIYKETSALISFTFDGIERGVDPNGNKFDVYSIRNPEIIKNTLQELNMDENDAEKIRKGIIIEGIVPQTIMERLTQYQSVVESGTNSSLAAVEKILETTYYPSRFKVSFNYSDMPYSSKQAARILNTMLNCYSKYFLETYGYNESLGSSIKALDYTDYDYVEALDVFESTLNSLKLYVNSLKESDSIRFRSTQTGLTFADLIDSINTINDVDLDKLFSYVTLNVITDDKDSLITYYQYRIESLQRHEIVCRENLAAVTDSINNYEKNTIQIFGAGTDDMNTTAVEASEAYDKLFEKKLSIQNDLSTTVQRISLYQKRLDKINTATVGTEVQKEKAKEKLESLNNKINDIIDKVSITADEYYETKVFAQSYNVLVPATSSATYYIKSALKDSILIVVVLDAVVFILFFGYAIIRSCIEEYNLKNGIKNDEKKKKLSSKTKQ